MQEKIKQLKEKLSQLEKDLIKFANNPVKIKTVSQNYTETKELLGLYEKLSQVTIALNEAERTLTEGDDNELVTLAEEQLNNLTPQKKKLEESINDIKHPTSPLDKKNVIMEIRAGTGGEEAALFAGDLFRMYSRWAEKQGWQTKLISSSNTGIGGFKEVIFAMSGKNVYKSLKYESGVHRVQRVPATEKSGRLHTSAATIAVMPEADEVDFKIDPKDLKIETSTSTGHGGQSVNTTYSAIRITHLPTGLVVKCQDERSQTQNKIKAMQVLRSRLLAQEEEKRMKEQAQTRKSQVGSGDRSEKIRTYNFPQNRVTDHRINLTIHNLDQVLDGNLNDIITALKKAEKENK